MADGRRGPKLVPVEQRLWPRVDQSAGPDGCWIWTGSRGPLGYGQIGIGPRNYGTHRVAYELLVGPIPDGMQLDHLCRNPPCCNPAHLEPVTPAENVRRGDAGKRYAARTHCPHGHPYDEANTYVYDDRRFCRECQRIRGRAYKAKKRAERS